MAMAASYILTANSSAALAPAVKDSSNLSSRAAFPSTLVQVAPLRPANLNNRVVVARASLPEEQTTVRRKVLAGFLAAGAALGFSGQAFAANPGGVVNVIFKEAEIKNKASPPRVGGAVQDAGQTAQKAGSGAVNSLQGSTSGVVDKAKANVNETKRRIDGIFGKNKGFGNVGKEIASNVEDATEGAKKGAESLFDKAKGKTGEIGNLEDAVQNVKKGAGNLVGKTQRSSGKNIADQAQKKVTEASSSGKGLISKTQNKASSAGIDAQGAVDQAKTAADDVQGKGKSLLDSIQNGVESAKDNLLSRVDEAKNAASDVAGNF